MANATSKGVGSGTAVLDDYGTLNQATAGFFKNYREDAKVDDAKEAAAAKKAKAAEDELTGKMKYDSSKVRIADRDLIQKQYKSLRDEFQGRWGEMDANVALRNSYEDKLAYIKNQPSLMIYLTTLMNTTNKAQAKQLYVLNKNPEQLLTTTLFSPKRKSNYSLLLPSIKALSNL